MFTERKEVDHQQKGPSTGPWGTPEASRNGLMWLNMNENQAGDERQLLFSRIMDPLAGRRSGRSANVVKYVSRVARS